ncbi:MAG: 30S ribosomal protein S9 [Chloroflexi bacterium]|nr:30S ribosomal protein S9 [Chloroflexota bacterium]
MDKQTYFHGTGRRKEAIAQVRLMPGNGTIIVDGKPYQERFPSLIHQKTIAQPMVATSAMNRYNVVVKVEGGGVTGQSQAISHGIARALVMAEEGLKPVLRQGGLLTRDPRVKERKKVGLKRARKAPQYTKR